MTPDREMIVMAVLEGQIPEYHLSQAEIDELFEIACDAATDKLMVEAAQRGCSVFDGVEEDALQ